MIKLDPEFEPLRHGMDRMHIILNNMGQGDHVLEAERFVRTTRDSFCTGFARTPYKKLPIALTIGLFLITIFGITLSLLKMGCPDQSAPKELSLAAV